MDDIRPRGTVEVKCSECGWYHWRDVLDPLLPKGPFKCIACTYPDGVPLPTEKATEPTS